MLRDCSRAISINPQSSKAYYRSALALVALERYEEALDCCDRCLQFDKDNKGVQAVREKAAKLKEEKDRKERERQERIRQEQLKKARLQAAYRVCRFVWRIGSRAHRYSGAEHHREPCT